MAFVYILKCRDGSLYTGVARDLTRRLAQHEAGVASKYTRAHRPVVLAWSRRMTSWAAALREEYRIKRLTRAGKEALLRGPAPAARRPARRAPRRNRAAPSTRRDP
ncbi:MAG: GIY-YIG nuclease family protein [Candidatus Rokubacteria bacterium]|nr:GIY-YIG nuclease family protein [Candidatus Rokubacteria bacterium]